MTTEDKFHAAVNVIKNLPKNGPYQPSNDLLLRFYCYYKQATEGPCKQSKPAFWEVVKRAKWEAWNGLGTMSKEMAMNSYIDELKRITLQIIETMPYTDTSVEFVDKLGPFYEMVDMPLPLPPKKNGSPPDLATEGRVNENDVVYSVKGSPAKNVAPVNDSAAPPNEEKTKIPNGVNSSHKVDAEWNDVDVKVQSNGTHVRESYSEKFYSGTESDEEEFSDPVDNDEFADDKMVDPLPLDSVSPTEDSGYGEPVNGETGDPTVVLDERKGQAWSFFPFRLGGGSAAAAPKMTNGFHGNGGDGHGSGTSPTDRMTIHGGGDPTATSGSTSRIYGSSLGHQRASRSRKGMDGRPFRSVSDGNASTSLGAGGGGRGHGPGGNGGDLGDNVNEQIAQALVQLQRDMESVLTRLNTLEALTVAHHNIAQGRLGLQGGPLMATGAERSWWPFKNMSFKTVAFFLTWPVFLHLVFLLIAAHRNRRLRRKLH